MISRRSFMGGLGATAIAGGAGAAIALPRTSTTATAAPVSGAAAALPVTIVNNSGSFNNGDVRVYIVGTDLGTGQQVHVNADGAMVPVQASDNTDDGYTDYALPLSDSGDTSLTLPSPMSGRIYFALGDKLRFKVVEAGDGSPALAYPAGWVESDPNFGVLHDTVEFTHQDDGMYCNTTTVDQFSVPIAIRLTGEQDQSTGALVEGGRDAIFEAVAALPDYSPLVVGDGTRIIAPGHGLDQGLFSDSYFAGYIDEVWARYASTDLSVTTNEGTFIGRVDGSDQLVFDGGFSPIAKPTTRDVLFCDGALAAPNDGALGPVAAILGAALNRATLLDSADQPTDDPAGFYTGDIANHYARVMHEFAEDGRAYGFAFDDVGGFASYIQDHAPQSFTITLDPF
ncbi:glycoside hydrolase family 64 protein [Nocardiopsis sediminis]|uniref:Glycoside hydrolase family 64 protein n=1 Tax=Nocardiopsis sediminis TaxID=1778267 RepID=A0ABV8FLW0_9ACTN